jgi:hypothetical protein
LQTALPFRTWIHRGRHLKGGQPAQLEDDDGDVNVVANTVGILEAGRRPAAFKPSASLT